MLGLQIQRSVSRSNSVIRTASGCSTISGSHNSIFRIKNCPIDNRMSRSQNRFSSGIRSISHPTDLSTFVTLKKSTATPTNQSRFAFRTQSAREEEDYEENEEVDDEVTGAKYNLEEVEKDKDEELDFEEAQPKYAASFIPYFQKNKPDQFRDNEDIDAEDLNKEAHNKYARAVQGKATAKIDTARYRLEVARSRVEDEDEGVRESYNVADVYREQYNKREKTFFAHLQPSNMKPFGSNDSLFFPLKNAKGEYPIFKRFSDNVEVIEETPVSSSYRGGPSQQREYSTVSGKKKQVDENKTQKKEFSRDKNERRGMAKEERPPSKRLSDVRKESRREKHRNEDEIQVKVTSARKPVPKPTFQSIQAKQQSQLLNTEKRKNVASDFEETETIKPQRKSVLGDNIKEQKAIDKALNFARKYSGIYLSKNESAKKAEALKPKRVRSKVDVLFSAKPKASFQSAPKLEVRTTSKLNVLQSTLSPDEAALLDKKPSKNQRMVPPWPAYSETIQKPYSPLAFIKYPTYSKKITTATNSTEPLHAREYSTGQLERRRVRRRLGSKTVLQRTFRLPRRRYYSSLDDRPDCPKPKKVPMKDCQPLKRPKRKKIKQRKKCVVKKKLYCPSRADSGLKVRSKKLPKISPSICKPEEHKLKDCAPLKRLKKVRIQEPSKCKIAQETCHKRADDDLRLRKKKLPVLEPEYCPKPKPQPMKDVKLNRLKKVKIKQPRKVCVKKSQFCTTRADASIKPKKKKLPIIEPIECPKPRSRPLKDAPALPRFKKIDIPEPPKICLNKGYFCSKRADEGLKIRSKSLPFLEPQHCPKPDPAPMKDCKLNRLPKMKFYDPPKCKKVKKLECPPRADAGLSVKSRELPEIVPHDNCKPRPGKMKDCKPLQRWPKRHVPEPPQCVIKRKDECVKRADEGMRLSRKHLPKLEASFCPEPEPHPLKGVSLRRLEKAVIPEPPKICKGMVAECVIARADDRMKVKKKQLPILEPMDCPTVPSQPMKDAKPLRRFPKIDIKEPPKICPKLGITCAERADKGLKIKSKSLPHIEPVDCEKPQAQPMKEGTPLTRLPKMPRFDPPKCKKIKKKVCLPEMRADVNLKVKSKSLPELKPFEGCKPKSMKMKDCKPLKRPKKSPVPEPEQCVLPDLAKCTIKRADEDLKVKRKQLPRLEPAHCPKLPPQPMKDVTLTRLKKVEIEEPPKVCSKKEIKCPTRADKGLKVRKKKLPELETPDCPKVYAKPMKDIKLPRLKKVKVEEPDKICPPEEKCPERADVTAGYKIKKKPLKTVILSKKYNEISIRKFKRKSTTKKAPYFKTKRKHYHVLTRSYSSHVYYKSKKRQKLNTVYRAKSVSATSKECAPKKIECPPKPPPCPPPKKSLWQRICDYFRARPGCPAPDEWKKKLLREKAEKAAKAAGLHLCEHPCYGKKKVTFKKKPLCEPKKKTDPCPKFKMPYCNEVEMRSCEKEPDPIECDPPMDTPYPSFSEWKREMRARKISECRVAEKKAKEVKRKIKSWKKKNKTKKRARCFSTCSSGVFLPFYTQERVAKIMNKLDNQLKKTENDDNNNVLKKQFLVM